MEKLKFYSFVTPAELVNFRTDCEVINSTLNAFSWNLYFNYSEAGPLLFSVLENLQALIFDIEENGMKLNLSDFQVCINELTEFIDKYLKSTHIAGTIAGKYLVSCETRWREIFITSLSQQ